MQRKIFLISILLAVLLIAGCSQTQSILGVTGKTTLVGEASDAQEVLVGLQGGRYSFTPDTIEANKPVMLKNDGTLRGCSVAMMQKELGINANFAREDTYTFTPKKTGEFRVTCSMGMYQGTLNIV